MAQTQAAQSANANKKISQLDALPEVTASVLLPVSVNGGNYAVSAGQLADYAKSSSTVYAAFSALCTPDASTDYSDGQAATLVVNVVWDTVKKNFYNRPAGNVHYYSFKGDAAYHDGNAPRRNVLYGCADGTLWRIADGDLVPFGLTAEQIAQIGLSTPVRVPSEEAMEERIAQGLFTPGQIYYTVEE